jgi:hypothetical protein
MSHFFVGVILHKDSLNKESIYNLMNPYCEYNEVEEYDRKCICAEMKGREKAEKEAEKEFGSWNELRDKFHNLYEKEKKTNEELNKLWLEFIKSKRDWISNFIEADLDKNKPDPDCYECNGTGFYKSTYNPDSKWDYFVIGGRWNGEICGKYKGDEKGGFNFDKKFNEIEQNYISIPDFIKLVEEKGLENVMPYAIVSPEGEWHEKGKLSYWGMSFEEKDDWSKIAMDLLRKYDKRYVIVGLDCHI